MRPIAIALPALLVMLSLFPNAAQASGFGWYACSVEWRRFTEEVDGWRDDALGLLSGADTPRLRAHLQLEVDSEISRYCEEWGNDETPSGVEFYSVALADYALAAQIKAGVADSFFRHFANPPETVRIEKREDRPFIDPIYFTLSPQDVRAFHAELVAMNRRPHPPEHAATLRYLEAVMAKTMNDQWTWASGPNAQIGEEFGNGELGLIFYGHD